MTHGWWWHFLHDPMVDNPAALCAAMLLTLGFVSLVWWWVARRG